jgi:hypothetical protein
MRWGSPVSCHIFGDRGLTHIDAELEEFAMDPERPKAGWRGSYSGSIGGFRAALSAFRREIATSIAKRSETQHDANG